MRIVQLIILAYSLSACQTEKDKLIGHWHSVPLEDDYYWTLNISDSTTQVNKYSTGEPEFLRYHEETGEESIFFDFEGYPDFEIRNDTLFIDENFRFLRAQEKHHLNDRFPGSLVRLDLHKSTSNSKVDLPRSSQLAHIYIGPPIKNVESIDLINPDSTFFQASGFLVIQGDRYSIFGYDHLKYFALYEAGRHGSGFWLAIHANSTTSDTTIDRLQALLVSFEYINGFVVSRYNYELDQLEYEELIKR